MNVTNLELKLKALELKDKHNISEPEMVDILMTVADNYTMEQVIEVLEEY